MSEAYEREAEDFLAALAEEYYQNGAGLKETLDLSPIYEQHAGLFTWASVDVLLAARATPADRHIAQFAAFEHLDSSARALTEEITNAETQATLQWDGKTIPYRLGSSLLGREPDRARRQQLHQRLLAITEQHNPRRADRLALMHTEVKGLGFAGYEPFCDELLGFDLPQLARQMQELLASTSTLWAPELRAALAEGEIRPDEADVSDLRYLLGAPQFDPLFPKENLLPALERTLAGIGISLESQSNIHLDTEERPLKSPRAFCAPVRVPSDVRLVIMPRGGREDYASLLHEAGHAEHLAHTDAAAPFPFRCLGDNSVTEAYAFVFDILLRSPTWLEQVAGIEPDDAYLRFARFYQIYYLRRYAAKLAYEQELHASDHLGPDLAARYSQLLGEAMGVDVPAASYLSDVDDGFYCAGYLRAWILEVHLRKELVAQFGDCWFATPGAGDFLKDLWRLGQELNADELAQRLGYPGLDVNLLIADLLSPPEA